MQYVQLYLCESRKPLPLGRSYQNFCRCSCRSVAYSTSVCFFLFSKVAVRVRPLNGAEVEDASCTEIVHVLDENVRVS